jgi:hypothetical protein
MKIVALWDIAPCSVIEVDRRFRGAYCLHCRFDVGGSTHLRNIGLLQQDNSTICQKAVIFKLAAMRTLKLTAARIVCIIDKPR